MGSGSKFLEMLQFVKLFVDTVNSFRPQDRSDGVAALQKLLKDSGKSFSDVSEGFLDSKVDKNGKLKDVLEKLLNGDPKNNDRLEKIFAGLNDKICQRDLDGSVFLSDAKKAALNSASDLPVLVDPASEGVEINEQDMNIYRAVVPVSREKDLLGYDFGLVVTGERDRVHDGPFERIPREDIMEFSQTIEEVVLQETMFAVPPIIVSNVSGPVNINLGGVQSNSSGDSGSVVSGNGNRVGDNVRNETHSTTTNTTTNADNRDYSDSSTVDNSYADNGVTDSHNEVPPVPPVEVDPVSENKGNVVDAQENQQQAPAEENQQDNEAKKTPWWKKTLVAAGIVGTGIWMATHTGEIKDGAIKLAEAVSGNDYSSVATAAPVTDLEQKPIKYLRSVLGRDAGYNQADVCVSDNFMDLVRESRDKISSGEFDRYNRIGAITESNFQNIYTAKVNPQFVDILQSCQDQFGRDSLTDRDTETLKYQLVGDAAASLNAKYGLNLYK